MRTSITLCIFTVLASACASTGPSPELVTARRAYAIATAPGTPVAQEPLMRAQEALNAAEDEHNYNPLSIEERHLAYIATRDAQIAVAEGKTQVAMAEARDANREYTAMLEGQVRSQQVAIDDLRKARAADAAKAKCEQTAKKE